MIGKTVIPSMKIMERKGPLGAIDVEQKFNAKFDAFALEIQNISSVINNESCPKPTASTLEGKPKLVVPIGKILYNCIITYLFGA